MTRRIKTEHAGPRDRGRKAGYHGRRAEVKAVTARRRRRDERAELREGEDWEVPIARLTFDVSIYPRVDRSEARADHLADVLEAGGQLPAVKIQRGTQAVLGGWHTVAAYQRLGRADVPVEIVDVADADRLLYAYREDAEAALPYTAADVRSVARRLYQQRSNGQGANVDALARDLGRARQTVARWIEDLVAADTEREELGRQARALAVHALIHGAGCSQNRAAALLDVSRQTGASDAHVGIAGTLGDARVVDAAHAVLVQTAARGSLAREREDARDWLIEQIDPPRLRATQRLRALTHVVDWLAAAAEQVAHLAGDALGGSSEADDPPTQEAYARLGQLLAALRDAADRIERSAQ